MISLSLLVTLWAVLPITFFFFCLVQVLFPMCFHCLPFPWRAPSLSTILPPPPPGRLRHRHHLGPHLNSDGHKPTLTHTKQTKPNLSKLCVCANRNEKFTILPSYRNGHTIFSHTTTERAHEKLVYYIHINSSECEWAYLYVNAAQWQTEVW